MKKQQTGLSSLKLIIIGALVLLVIIGGVVYLLRPQQPIEDESTETEQAVDQDDYLAARRIIFDQTAIFFDQPNTDQATVKLPLKDPVKKNQLESKRQEIISLLQTWAKLLKEASTQTDIPVQTITAIQTYLASLKELVNTLSPASSGLTASEIGHYQSIINQAEADLPAMIDVSASTDEKPLINKPIFDPEHPRLIEGINND